MIRDVVLFIPKLKGWSGKRYMLGKVIKEEGEYVYIKDVGGVMHVTYARDVRIIGRET